MLFAGLHAVIEPINKNGKKANLFMFKGYLNRVNIYEILWHRFGVLFFFGAFGS